MYYKFLSILFCVLIFAISHENVFSSEINDSCYIVKSVMDGSGKSGDNQHQTIGKELLNPVSVLILDEKNNPVAGVPVYFEDLNHPTKSKGFHLSDRIVYTNNKGIAQIKIRLGDLPGDYEIIARLKNSNQKNYEIYKFYARESNWLFMLVIGIAGGLVIFIFGMKMMSAGLQKSAGDKMRVFLSSLTNNRFIAFGVGTFITGLTQSSATTAIMLISFVQAGMMAYTQTIGILLGASVGGTITAQLIAFKITEFSLLLVAMGFIMTLFIRMQKVKQIGETIMGFGMLFFGMYIMADALSPLKTYQPFIDVLQSLDNPFLGIIIGTAFTAIVQSSGAFIGIIILLASQGILSIEAGVALMLGTNLGTAVTAVIAAAGTSREAKKVAASQVLFKFVGVVLVLIILPYFVEFVKNVSPVSVEKTGSIAALADEVPRQVANAHTFFNLLIAFIFLPFTVLIAKIANKMVPLKKDAEDDSLKLLFLDDNLITTPTLALNVAKQETIRLAETIHKMSSACIFPFTDKSNVALKLIESKEKLVNYLYAEINKYLIKVSQQTAQEDRVKEAFQMMSVVRELEHIGDIVSKNIAGYAERWINSDLHFSEQGKAELCAYHVKMVKQINRAIEVFRDVNLEKAKVMKKKFKKYSELASEFELSHLSRVKEDIRQSVESSEIHVEFMEMMKSINRHTTNIARILQENHAVSDKNNDMESALKKI